MLRLLTKAVRQVGPGWSAEDREDLTQTTVIKVMEWIEKHGREPDHSFAFVRQVAYRTMIDEIRRRQLRREEPLSGESGEDRPFPARDPGPRRRLMSTELAQGIKDCLETLIPDRRRAMTLRLLGHPNREVAKLTGWAAKKAENLSTRAHKDMKQCLAEKGLNP